MRPIAVLLAAALLLAAPDAFAQSYPDHFITLISPFPAGGPSDTAARIIAGPMSKALGQQIVIDNVSGAGGVIGTSRAAKAAPDGYTLIVSGSGTHAAAEFLQKNLPYRQTDFDHIGLINLSPMVIVAKKDIPADNLQDFIAYLRTNEKKVTEADAGVGSVSNLACAVFHSLVKVHPTVASYRGTPQATMDLVAGNVDFGCNQIVNVAQHVKSGALKAYAVTSDRRTPMLPAVPTSAEAGLPAFNLSVWFGLSAPKGMPQPIIEKLSAALNVALDDPDVVKRFADLGYDVASPQQRGVPYFRKFVADEIDLWTRVLGNLSAGKKQ